MSRPATPQLKHSEVSTPKTPQPQPGPNSWAQSAEKAGKMKVEKPGPPTNRDKYENKPMPPLPLTPDQGRSPNAPGQPGYIQPATPLIYSKPSSNKNRAVTDPVATKNLFGSNNVSIGELRRKFSGNKIGVNLSSIEETSIQRSRTPRSDPVELPTGPTAAGDVKEKRHDNLPSSAPPSTNAPDPFRSSNTQGQQHQSSPAPTWTYVNNNDQPRPFLTSANIETHWHESTEATSPSLMSPDGIIMGDGRLNPTRNGTWGTIGEVEYVQGKAVHRVASFAGVIETASSPGASETQRQPRSANTNSGSEACQGQNLTHLLHPNGHSPNGYGGVWENDSHVGHTLPPFSPMPPRRPFELERQHKDSSVSSRGTVPVMLNAEAYGPPSRLSAYPLSVASTNSWAPEAQDSSNPPSSATVPPLFSGTHNAVPPPPPNYRDYQPPAGQVPAELARLELTMHHHLDSCFGSLSRLVTDKHDSTVDQVLRRLESHERKTEKAFKSVKNDIKDVGQGVEILRAEVQQIQSISERFKECLDGSDAKTDILSAKLDEVQFKLAQGLVDVGASVREAGTNLNGTTDQPVRQSTVSQYPEQPNGLSPTRSRSTHTSPGLQSQGFRYQSGASQNSGDGRHSGTNSRGRRSNTATGGTGARSSDGRSSRRGYYAEMGAAMGDAPDLRQHPAFIAQQQTYGYDVNGVALGMASDGSLYQMPSFAGHGPNGWYHQAYGQS